MAGCPFSDEEIERLKVLLKEADGIDELITADKRRRWLLSAIAGSARWIAIVLTAYFAVRGFMGEALTGLLGYGKGGN